MTGGLEAMKQQLKTRLVVLDRERDRILYTLEVLNRIDEPNQGTAKSSHEPGTRLVSAPVVDETVRAEWTALSKTDAIARCLNEAKEPLSPSDVVSRLAAVGRDENNDQIRAGLAYLKRLGRAQLLRRGQWVTARPPAITNDSKTTDVKAPSSVPEDWRPNNAVENYLLGNQII